MELRPLKHYYSAHLKSCLRDGDNKYIKKYTTEGFIKSYQMWSYYSHNSIKAFFQDFNSNYSDAVLALNCGCCLREMHENGSTINYDDLFDILLRRLVIDAFIGFKAEEIISEKLKNGGCEIHDYNVLPISDERELDTKYGVDIMTFNNGKVSSFIQIKNTSTFGSNGNYIKKIRKEFFDKEKKANEYIHDGTYRTINFYVYDKNAYINEGKFKYFINPKTDKCSFKLDELIEKDGTLKINVKHLKSRELL